MLLLLLLVVAIMLVLMVERIPHPPMHPLTPHPTQPPKETKTYRGPCTPNNIANKNDGATKKKATTKNFQRSVPTTNLLFEVQVNEWTIGHSTIETEGATDTKDPVETTTTNIVHATTTAPTTRRDIAPRENTSNPRAITIVVLPTIDLVTIIGIESTIVRTNVTANVANVTGESIETRGILARGIDRRAVTETTIERGRVPIDRNDTNPPIDIRTTDERKRWGKDDGDSPNDRVISNRESTDVPPTIIDTNRDTNGGIAKNFVERRSRNDNCRGKVRRGSDAGRGRMGNRARFVVQRRLVRRRQRPWCCLGMRNRIMPHLKRAERNRMKRMWC
jgi:hypothetical protein